MKIACPKCAWEPTASDRWSCSCGHDWNTFDTGGQCPACRTVWRDTQCLACKRWSKHHDWYHDLPPVDALLGEAEAQDRARLRLGAAPEAEEDVTPTRTAT